ncbi:O-antigen ligase family protein [Phenylobacterium sp.]|uniref:O-antigen ligase family protein n=1 Tax=Phenylobacterium sp. TaxID=1871053 RepID=UPI0028122F6F|nr:O-antigen ligase family protein [Phenylobacterium sp.]
MIGAAVLAIPIAWLGPLAFAPLMGLAGLLCLPALRLEDEDRPVAVMLFAGLVWAGMAASWSPHRPDELEDSIALKLALQLPLYWAAWCGARRADPFLRRRALSILAWGLAAVGAVMVVEALTGGAVYQAIRAAIGDPARPDLARKNLAQASFGMALLWPVVAAGGMRAGQPWWLAAPMAIGAGLLAFLFLSDAPVLAVGLSVFVGVVVLNLPRSGPKALALAAAAFFLLTPAALLGLRSLLRALQMTITPPDSWAQRLGYWSHSLDAIAVHPIRGWGLDASRAFSPEIILHPHNGALQVWLELGVPGAVCAALFWAFLLRRLSRERADLAATAACASAAVYLLFGAINFGIWQEWWLGLGALACVIVGLMSGENPAPQTGEIRRTAAKTSTAAAFSG